MQENNFKNHKWQALILAVLFCAIVFGSCTQAEIIAERFNRQERTEEGIITALIPDPVPEAAAPSTSNIILERGNYWTAGIPGFGENALSAFTGEYRIPGIENTIKVWLTMEFIYYNGWSSRTSITSINVSEKMGYEGRIVASTLNENWTAIMSFPLGSGLSRQDEDRIIIDLVSKFSGFTAQNPNISLPAIVEY